MFKIPLAVWIANAAARLNGTQGQVTHQAEAADCRRQTVSDHAPKVQAAVDAEHAGGPTRAELLEENQPLRQENARLGDGRAQTVEFPPAKPPESTVTATAMGLSLNQVLVLLALIRGEQARPGRSTIQRWIQAAGHAAGRVLKDLDGPCQALVLVGGLEEIFFHRRRVLVGVEPARRVWFLGPTADDRTGATWAKALPDGTALEYVLADAGTGLPAGIAAVPQQRPKDGPPALENGLEVFHTTPETPRVVRLSWNRVEHLWEPADAADRRVAPTPQPGQDARGVAAAAGAVGTKAEAAFPPDERSDAGGKIAPAARQVVRPDGQLNDRAWARQPIALALPQLSGREWSKGRGFLPTEATWTFRDRLHRAWEAAAPDPEGRAELVRRWWLRRQRPRATTAGVPGGAGPGAPLVPPVVCPKRDANWHESSWAVARVLRPTVRARSAVACMKSVLRMHPARHRTVPPGLLDLKRLYWNGRAFRGGQRRGRCP